MYWAICKELGQVISIDCNTVLVKYHNGRLQVFDNLDVVYVKLGQAVVVNQVIGKWS